MSGPIPVPGDYTPSRVQRGAIGLLWPGINMIKALLDGEPIRGTWFDHTQEYRARLRGEAFEPRRYASEETVVLSQLPCWRHLSQEVYRELVIGLISEIERDAAAERKHRSQHI
jgi:hypothetical protein